MPPRRMHLTDDIGWRWCDNRVVTVRSTYDVRTEISRVEQESVWRAIAKYRGTPRVQLFLWMAPSNRVLTNAEQIRRHMLDYSMCGVCWDMEESIDHLVIWLTHDKL
ncbi:hypothetical protein V6N13_142626 [Hibiscus sabdariffa]